MKKLKILFASVVLVFSSCNHENEINSDSMSSQKDLICTFDLIDASNNMTSKPDAAIIDWPRWQTGQTIKIKFLDGAISEQEIVKIYASEWIKYANLKFEFVPKNEYADIRIGFNLGAPGAWSQLGMKSAYGVGNYQNEPSMRLGPIYANENSKQTILHEFGHALGLVHETTNPSATIKWDLPKVYKYYDDLMGWSKENVDLFVINPRSVTNYSEYDPFSIMHYYIPPSLTTDGVGVNEMKKLSITDMVSISEWYPYPIQSTIKSGENIGLIPFTRLVKSPNGMYVLEFKSGVLKIVDIKNQKTTWEVGSTYPLPLITSSLLEYGNLVIKKKVSGLSASTSTIWRSGNFNFTGECHLQLQNDGNLVLFHDGIAKWSSKEGKP
jgi:hypothetical protein